MMRAGIDRMASFGVNYLESLAACGSAAICWGGTAYAAARLSARLLPEARGTSRACAAAAAWATIVIVTCEALGTIGALRRGPAAAAGLAWLIAGHWFRARGSAREGAVGGGARRLAGPTAWGLTLIGCVVAAVAATGMYRALRDPPLDWDSLTHHAFIPARWVQHGVIDSFAAPGGMDGYRAFPIHGALLTAWSLLPFQNDVCINLTGYGLLLWTAAALYGAAGVLGAGRAARLSVLAVFCTTPRVWSLAGAPYADLLLAATIATGWLFLLHHLRGGGGALLCWAGLAFGLAAGTKYTALPGLLVIFLFVVIHAARRRSRRTALAELGLATAIAVAAGGYKYARNWMEFSNPVYPMGVAVAGRTVFPMSSELRAILAVAPAGDRGDGWRHLAYSLSPGPENWGPAGLAVCLLAGWGIVMRRRGGPGVVLLGMLWLMGLAMLYVPESGMTAHVRRGWPEASQRLVVVGMAAAACLAAAAVGSSERAARWAPWAALALIAVNVAGRRSALPSGTVETIVAIFAVAGMLAALRGGEGIRATAARAAVGRWRAGRLGAATAGAVVAAAALLPHVDNWRDSWRYARYAGAAPSAVVRRQAAAWKRCDDMDRGHVVALVGRRVGASDDPRSHAALNWFFYPLMGSRWQNEVVAAPIVQECAGAGTDDDAGRGRTDAGTEWVDELRRRGVDRLFVLAGARPESAWIAERPEVFEPVLKTTEWGVYAVRRASDGDRRTADAAEGTRVAGAEQVDGMGGE